MDARDPLTAPAAPRPAAPARPGGLEPAGGSNLADILERVLDKGVVIAGDIRINLLDIELLTIKLRLVVASVERAKEMGIDWWEDDPSLSSRAGRRALDAENARLRARLAELEAAGAQAGGDRPAKEDETR
ncbi:gas vesicle protein [Streptomyces pactum]|uniref:Gas vesicle protein n=1 Tax=Streptomyces pactum TaxID=68249 RepID=A0ABS0NSK6_9ACTN|nr:gas vesicle protein [Streptomyces pactum]MBH5338183.1 gas vesicle protein [Streptomyces pactum]